MRDSRVTYTIFTRDVEFLHDQSVRIKGKSSDPFSIIELQIFDGDDSESSLSIGLVEAESLRDALTDVIDELSAEKLSALEETPKR